MPSLVEFAKKDENKKNYTEQQIATHIHVDRQFTISDKKSRQALELSVQLS